MLTRGLVHEGVQAFVRSYLREDVFVGRTSERASLQAFVEGSEARALLGAPAGRGKSALVLRWAEHLDDAGHLVAWVPISLRFGTYRSATVDDLLSARLRILLGKKGHWRELLSQHEGPPLLVVLDGLDELQDHALLDALRELRAGATVKLLATVRPGLDLDEDAWVTRLGWAPCARLTLGPLSTGEVAEWVTGHASERGGQVRAVMDRTGGDPLLVRVCKDALDRGQSLPDVRDPADLIGAWWAEQRAGLRAPEDAVAERVLATLGAACGVLPWSVLAGVVGEREDEVRQALRLFDRFVVEVPGRGVAFAHPRFNEIARWAYPEASQLAQQRFAELVLESRDRESPPDPYFLHFGLAHLEAAGVPEEQMMTLARHSSTLAWLAAEGSAFGHLNEVLALLRRSTRWLDRVWGSDAMPAALEAQAFLMHTATLLRAEVRETDPNFLLELVRHGLRTPDQAIDWVVSRIESAEVEKLFLLERLPALLPDEAMTRLVSLCLQHPELASLLFPWLVKAGRWDDLFECMASAPALELHVVSLWHQLPAPQLERLRRHLAHALSLPYGASLEMLYLPALPATQQLELLARQERAVLDLTTGPPQQRLGLLLDLMSAAARLGQGSMTLRLLRALQADEGGLLSRGEEGYLEGSWGSLLELLALLHGNERAEALTILADLMRRRPPSDVLGWGHLARMPEDFPGRADLLEALWSHFESSSYSWSILLDLPTAEGPLGERASEIVRAKLQRWVEQQEAARRDSDTSSTDGDDQLDVGITFVQGLHLAEPDRLVPLLRRAFALHTNEQPLDPMDLESLLSLALTNTRSAPVADLLRTLLQERTVLAGPWLWQHGGDEWLAVMEPASRAELLRQHMHTTTDPGEITGELERALFLLDPARESAVAARLVALLQLLQPGEFIEASLLAPASRAQMSDDELRSLSHRGLENLLASQKELTFSATFDAFLRTDDPRLDRPALAASFVGALTPDRLPPFPVEAEALALLPPGERRAWAHQCASPPASEVTDLASWLRGPGRWLPEELDALAPSPPLRHPEFTLPAVLDDRAGLVLEPSATDRQALAWLRRLPAALRGELSGRQDLVAAALRAADARALVELAPMCLALGDELITSDIRTRAMQHLYRGGPEREALEALLAPLMPPAPTSASEDADLSQTDFLAWAWHHRTTPPHQLPWPFKDYGTIAAPEAVQLGLQEPLARWLPDAAVLPQARFEAIYLFWEALSPASRQALQPAIAEYFSSLSFVLDSRFRPLGPLHDWGLCQVDETTRRQAWSQQVSLARESAFFPVDTLRLMGGTAAVEAWASGLVDALEVAPYEETTDEAGSSLEGRDDHRDDAQG